METMSRLATMLRQAPGRRIGPLAFFAASCVPMLVMLPAGLTGVLASVGIRAQAGWVQTIADPLGPIAQPLLIVATLALAAGSLACGRAPVAAALAGGTLLYLSMYVLTRPGGLSDPALFYPGLALFLSSPLLSLVRPRLRACRPLLSRARRRAALLATVPVSALLLAMSPTLGWGNATAGGHTQHLRGAGAGTAMMGMAGSSARRQHATGAGTALAPGKPIVRVGANAFLWSGSVDRYTFKKPWFPPLSTDGAALRIRGQARAGSVSVQLMDGRAVVVWERTFARIPSRGLAVGVRGARGVWMVTLRFRSYTGRLRVEVGPVAGG